MSIDYRAPLKQPSGIFRTDVVTPKQYWDLVEKQKLLLRGAFRALRELQAMPPHSRSPAAIHARTKAILLNTQVIYRFLDKLITLLTGLVVPRLSTAGAHGAATARAHATYRGLPKWARHYYTARALGLCTACGNRAVPHLARCRACKTVHRWWRHYPGPRTTIHCRHCGKAGHNITKCPIIRNRPKITKRPKAPRMDAVHAARVLGK